MLLFILEALACLWLFTGIVVGFLFAFALSVNIAKELAS